MRSRIGCRSHPVHANALSHTRHVQRTILPSGFPAVGRKKLVAAFDGGRITSDGGVLLLGAVERRLGVAAELARLIADPRNPAFVSSAFSASRPRSDDVPIRGPPVSRQ